MPPSSHNFQPIGALEMRTAQLTSSPELSELHATFKNAALSNSSSSAQASTAEDFHSPDCITWDREKPSRARAAAFLNENPWKSGICKSFSIFQKRVRATALVNVKSFCPLDSCLRRGAKRWHTHSCGLCFRCRNQKCKAPAATNAAECLPWGKSHTSSYNPCSRGRASLWTLNSACQLKSSKPLPAELVVQTGLFLTGWAPYLRGRSQVRTFRFEASRRRRRCCSARRSRSATRLQRFFGKLATRTGSESVDLFCLRGQVSWVGRWVGG